MFGAGREMESPRFHAILSATSGQRKHGPADVKSFSHELNSRGPQHPMRKLRGVSNPKEFIGVIKTKFNKLKEEVDSELGVFARDLVGVLEKNTAEHPEWCVTLEDLLVTAQKCAEMSSEEFWLKCDLDGEDGRVDGCQQRHRLVVCLVRPLPQRTRSLQRQ